jgi:hypothetical protein
MNTLKRSTMILLVSILMLFFFGSSKIHAGNEIDGFSFFLPVACKDALLWTYDYQPSGTASESFEIRIVDAATFVSINASIGTGITGNLFYSSLVSPGTILLVGFYDDFGGSAFQQVTVSDCWYSAPSPGQPHVPRELSVPQIPPCHTDGRLDPLNCAAPVGLYLSSDEDGWFLQVWLITEESEGEFLFDFYQDDLPEVGTEPLLLAQDDAIALYLLPTGELQVNAPYLAEPSKFYVFIFEVPSGIGYHRDMQME